MKTKTTLLLLCGAISILFFSCRASSMQAMSDSVKIEIALPANSVTSFFSSVTSSSDTDNRAVLNNSNAQYSLTVTGEGMDDMATTFTLAEGSYTTSVYVPIGEDRTFTLSAKDVDGVEYANSSSVIDVTSATTKIDLNLKPVATIDEGVSESALPSKSTKVGKVYVLQIDASSITNLLSSVGSGFLNITSASGTLPVATDAITFTPAKDDKYYLMFTKISEDGDNNVTWLISKGDGTQLASWEDTEYSLANGADDTDVAFSDSEAENYRYDVTFVEGDVASHSITYDTGVDGEKVTVKGTAPIDSRSYSYGDAITILGNTNLTVDSEGDSYTFVGWTDTSNDNPKIIKAGSTVKMGTSDVTLYPVWAHSILYTVDFDNTTGYFLDYVTKNQITNGLVKVATYDDIIEGAEANEIDTTKVDYTSFDTWSPIINGEINTTTEYEAGYVIAVSDSYYKNFDTEGNIVLGTVWEN